MTAYPTGPGESSSGCCDDEADQLAAIVALLADRPVTVFVRRVTGEPLSGHRLVAPGGPDGDITYTDATDQTYLTLPIWLTTSASGLGETAVMVAYGVVVEPSWAWEPGDALFLGTGGRITTEVPTPETAVFYRRIGTALDETSIFYNPEPPVALIPVLDGYTEDYPEGGYEVDDVDAYFSGYEESYEGAGNGFVGGYGDGY